VIIGGLGIDGFGVSAGGGYGVDIYEGGKGIV
jgi:hypothetical protein